MTPFLLAAAEGKKVAFEVLHGDDRLDKNARTEKDQSALELINAFGNEVRVKKSMELLAKQGKMAPSNESNTKLAVIIGNSEYQANSGWDDLPGAKEDVVAMKARLTDDGYQVEVIENSTDFLKDIEDLMYKIPVASVTHLQVLYVGKSTSILSQKNKDKRRNGQVMESTRRLPKQEECFLRMTSIKSLPRMRFLGMSLFQ